jgi:hypothetical protein
MILRYEKGSFDPISFFAFIHGPAAYSSTPIVVYEPFQGTPPECTPVREERMSSAEVTRVVHQTFKVVPILFKDHRLWTLASATVAQFTLRELQDAMKSYPWDHLCCESAADPSDLFFDLRPDTSFLSAFRPPQTTVRSSAPAIIPPSAASPPLSLMARRSQQASTLQTTFLNGPVLIQDIPILGSNEYDPIVDHLYIGSENAARNGTVLSSLGITHVVHLNAGQAKTGFPTGFQNFTVAMSDSPFEELSPEFWDSIK